MIPRLDIAVERGAFGARFDGPPWWATLEQVTERLRGTIPDTYGAAELRAQGETLHDKLLANIATVVWELISFNGEYVWPSEPLKERVRPFEICALRSSNAA
jgi:hypothetical protein